MDGLFVVNNRSYHTQQAQRMIGGISQFSKGKYVIKKDGTVRELNKIEALLWKVFKRFACLRKLLFDVDTQHTAKLLRRLRSICYSDGNPDTIKLYRLAVKKFNETVRKHKVSTAAPKEWKNKILDEAGKTINKADKSNEKWVKTSLDTLKKESEEPTRTSKENGEKLLVEVEKELLKKVKSKEITTIFSIEQGSELSPLFYRDSKGLSDTEKARKETAQQLLKAGAEIYAVHDKEKTLSKEQKTAFEKRQKQFPGLKDMPIKKEEEEERDREERPQKKEEISSTTYYIETRDGSAYALLVHKTQKEYQIGFEEADQDSINEILRETFDKFEQQGAELPVVFSTAPYKHRRPQMMGQAMKQRWED